MQFNLIMYVCIAYGIVVVFIFGLMQRIKTLMSAMELQQNPLQLTVNKIPSFSHIVKNFKI